MLNISMNPGELSRRNFIKMMVLGLTSMGIKPIFNFNQAVDFPDYERLGRVCIIGRVDIKSAPYEGSETVGVLYEDAVIPWLKELVAKGYRDEFNKGYQFPYIEKDGLGNG